MSFLYFQTASGCMIRCTKTWKFNLYLKDVWRSRQVSGPFWTWLTIFRKCSSVLETSRGRSVGIERDLPSTKWDMEKWKQYYRGLIMLLLGKKRLWEDWSLPWKCQCLLTHKFVLFSKMCGSRSMSLHQELKRSRDEEKQSRIHVLLCSNLAV